MQYFEKSKLMQRIHDEQNTKILNEDRMLLIVLYACVFVQETVIFKWPGLPRPMGPSHPLQGRLMKVDNDVQTDWATQTLLDSHVF